MRYIIFWLSGKTTVVEGSNIVSACVAAKITPNYIHSYARESDLEGMGSCGFCTKVIEGSTICEHDIESYRVNGVISNTFREPYPQLTEEERLGILDIVMSKSAIMG